MTKIEVAINVRSSDGDHKNMRIPVTLFDSVSINLRFDSVASTFKLGIDFDPLNEDHAELCCVTHMHECEIFFIHESGFREKMLTGFMLSNGFANSSKPELSQLGGYSRAGLLGDCSIPSSCPIESNGLTFTQVVKKVLASLNAIRAATISNPLNFEIESSRANQVLTDVDKKDSSGSQLSANLKDIIKKVEQKANGVIPKTTAQDSVNALSYLKNIAIQKRLILSHNAEGDLIVGIPNTSGTPLFEIDNDEFGTLGVTDMRLIYDGQKMHSHITVIRQADKDGGNAAEYTIENPLCPIVYRPLTTTLSFGDDITIEQAARNELGNDLRGVVLKITLDRWEIDGKLITPNNTILVRDKKLYLYRKTKWFIESVDFASDMKKDECVITCVLPYVYNDEEPVNPFVEPKKNTPLT